MVMAPTPTHMICIDTTEVTQAQYQQFLDAKNGDTSGQATECAWNNVYAPSLMCTFDPTGRGAYPVNGVDWCDATAYCKWTGKRLCGGPTGGLISTSAITDLQMPQISEWTAVCSHGGERAYPYGTAFSGTACNGGESMTTPAIVPVATTPGCVGGYPGIYDMLGNVHEWEDACYSTGGAPGAADKCWFRGGSYHDLGDSCSSAWDVRRDYVDYLCDIGFRCCADP
jgi:formylglycine-generating enzyme required for sulfatase activity